jgi:hypothetical protein
LEGGFEESSERWPYWWENFPGDGCAWPTFLFQFSRLKPFSGARV